MATVRRTSVEFNYQLVVTRVYEEGEEALLEEEDETDDERVFLISSELQFHSSSFDGQPTFIWRDTEGDEDEHYEFVAAGCDEPTRVFFESSVLQALYERTYQKSADKAKTADLKKLMYIPPAPTPGSRPGASPTNTRSANATRDVADQLARTSISSPQPSSSPPPPAAMSPPQQPVETPTAPAGTCVISLEAELLEFDYEADAFRSEGDHFDAEIILADHGNFNYFIVVLDEGSPWLAHELTSQLNCKWSKKYTSFRWNYPSNSEFGLSAWCLRFKTDEAYEEFKDMVGRCLWENNNGVSWESAKKEDAAYAEQAYNDQDVEMADAYPESEDEEEAVEDALQGDESDGEPSNLREEDSEEESDSEEAKRFYEGREVNTGLASGYRGDRTFVMRGQRIGVFRHNEEGGVEHAGTINKIQTPKGKAFTPSKFMLHQADSAMVLNDPKNPHSLYRMDLEAGKVVEEWKVHDDIPVSQIAPDSKFAPTQPGQTLVGTSHNAIFRIDPRLSGNKLVDSEWKQYTTKAAFSAVTTTEEGHLAVASEKGDIRLFDTIGKIAKTALPAMGDPIIGIDVTASGRYIVATCKTHLYVIDTLINDGKFSGKLGFERSFPASSRPVPKRLQLKPEHVLYMRSEVSFTPARFNIGPDLEENSIITSSGNYVIAWDFKKIKQGILDKYEIKQYDDKVVQDEFRFANDKDIVVALQNNVLMVNKKKLKKPTRASLATPARVTRSSRGGAAE
ncbi:hypothetical protein FS837_010912 [Tulasnella sp. UAMH 9824]|nr:hypothetical protein FS837_010912 [Tulasnella sp. UAMH 9824]